MMKQRSANIILAGTREIRAINDPCDPACFTWYACANSKPNGKCEGFILMNGETRKHLNKILNDGDAHYIEDCVRMVQNKRTPEEQEYFVQEVLRFIPPREYPEICDKRCPHVQCSSWGTPEMDGKPCRNRVPSNEELEHPQPEAKIIIMRNMEAEDKAVLQSIPRNSKLGSIIDRLEKIEEQVSQVEKLEKEPEKAMEFFPVIPKGAIRKLEEWEIDERRRKK